MMKSPFNLDEQSLPMYSSEIFCQKFLWNCLGIFCDFFVNFAGIFREFFKNFGGNSAGILWEFLREVIVEFFGKLFEYGIN